MTTCEQKVQDWFISEIPLLTDSRLKRFPETSVFCRLTEGKQHKRIWKYVVDHVRSRCAADKVRRILTVKECHQELENPYAFTNASHLLERIAKAKEKRSFIQGSLTELKKELESSEKEVQGLSDEICTINQKSAMLELIATEYKQKTVTLNSIKTVLSFHFERNSKPNDQFYLSQNIPLTSNAVSSSNLKYRDDREYDEIKYALQLMASHLKDSESLNISGSCKDNLKNRVDKMIKTYSLVDIFIILKELSNKSCMELMSKESYSYSTEDQTGRTANSNAAKYLQDMKLEFIRSSFNLKKTNREIQRLQDVKKVLLKKFMANPYDAEFGKKFKLFETLAEKEGLGESIKFLENCVKTERYEGELLKEVNNEKLSGLNNLELAVRNFYANFDKLCFLLKSGPNIHESVLKSLSNMYKFINEEMFSIVTCSVKNYPFELKRDLEFDIQTMWSVMGKCNILNPLVPVWLSVNVTEHEMLANMLGVSKYESECVIAYRVKNLKEKISSNRDKEFKFNEDVVSQTNERYILMANMLQEMQCKLELCGKNFAETSEHIKRDEAVLEDWWKQGAQFIPQIEYEDKSLKMWLDILFVLPDLLITDV